MTGIRVGIIALLTVLTFILVPFDAFAADDFKINAQNHLLN
jgi:hypothetical protein